MLESTFVLDSGLIQLFVVRVLDINNYKINNHETIFIE